MATIRSFILGTFATLALSGTALADPQSGMTGGSASKNLVDTAESAGRFTLARGIRATGPSATRTGKGLFTVFAATDEALERLPAGTLDDLLKPKNKSKLQAILKYHAARTLEGASLAVAVSNGTEKVGRATVAKSDVVASKGVIHVIDKVLLPPPA